MCENGYAGKFKLIGETGKVKRAPFKNGNTLKMQNIQK